MKVIYCHLSDKTYSFLNQTMNWIDKQASPENRLVDGLSKKPGETWWKKIELADGLGISW